MASRTQDARASVPPPARKVAAAASTTEKATGSVNVEVFAGRAVYLDADERTNRIVMVGYAEELTAIDGIIDALDLAQQDLRVPRVYQIRRLHAADVLARLKDLEVVGDTPATVPTIYKSTSATPVAAYPATLEPQIRAELPQATAIEPTNALLIKATEEQHAYLATVIGHIDMMQDELRQLEVYDIQHVDAHDVKKKIEELRGKAGAALPLPPAGPVETGSAPAAAGPAREATLWETAPLEPQILVLETTNSVLVSAPEEQQRWVAEVIARIDVPARQEAIPYEIYFLENQEPEHMAEVLQKIIQETVRDKEGKIEKTVPKIDEEITIVPDQNTFAVIVYGNRRNQEWISKLIQTLDKRRPQVLIDATLVEIRRNDEFNYDLEMVAGIPDLTVPSGQTGQFLADENTTVTERLQQSGRDRIVDFQMSSGKGIGFYGDRHIQALLTAVQAKNYGRVLAKPKVLVNDNEKGSIKTADTTYVVTKSSIPVVQGAAGTQNQLIETAIRYEPYEAGITLNITPHTSEGDLLRLEIELTRSDFTSTSDDKPPNQTSSNVGTVITVPDGSTIILGGMLKLNQNRGGNKVPLLGDLPLVGGLFRSIDSRDIQSMLYIFVRAEIIRPAEGAARGSEDLKRISTENREAFEQHEHEFQRYELWPGVKPRPMSPPKALDAR
jgi:general secretion pathway protein D